MVIQVIKTFFWYSSSVYFATCSQSLLLLSLPNRSLPFLSFMVPILPWNISLISPIFLKKYLVFPILLFSSIFFCIVPLRRLPFLSLLLSGILHSVGYIFPYLPCLSLLFFPQLFVKPPRIITLSLCLLAFLFLWTVLVTASCTILWISVHSSSGILATKSNPLNPFVISTDLSHIWMA